MPPSNTIRYLTAAQAANAKKTITDAIARAMRELEGLDCDPRGVQHELAMILARAACRFDLDLLNGAGATIERLEAVVAELGARLEQAKIATGHVEGERFSASLGVGAINGNGDAFRYMAPERIPPAMRDLVDSRSAEDLAPRAGIDAEFADELRALAENGSTPHPFDCRCAACRT